VTVPKLIRHDPSNFVLCIEDLGSVGTLWDLLEPKVCNLLPRNRLAEQFNQYGQRVGTFFAALHSKGSFNRVQGSLAAINLTHSLTNELVLDAAVRPILERLQRYAILDAEELYRRVLEDYTEPQDDYGLVMTLGDFHPGSILVQGSGSDLRMAIIDWEFANLQGRGVNGDIAQLLAHVYCYMFTLAPQDATHRATSSFMSGVCDAYGKAALPDPGLLRSYLTILGREMINQALDKDWHVADDILTRMVETGASYIRTVGDSNGEMSTYARRCEALEVDPAFTSTLFRHAFS
jgi:Phosphotransferase enzyme family